MKKKVLANGLTIITKHLPTKSAAIVVTVKVGSNYENDNNNGISHFIEHMVFEGTKNRPDARIIANEIESLGGEINAYTSTERTSYWIRILGKYFDNALDVMSDILQNPIFAPKSIEKERQIVLKEINMVTDEPRFHQWILFQKTLFQKHPARRPTYGTAKAIKSIGRQDLIDFHKGHYLPNNMVISVVGNIPPGVIEKIEKAFKFKRGKAFRLKNIVEPEMKAVKKLVEKRGILNSYMVLGYKTVTRNEADSYVLDVIRAILGRGQSGRMFDEIRNKRGLAYEIGVQNESLSDYGYFTVYLNTDKKNINSCTRIILREFNKLKEGKLSEKEIKEAKAYLEGEFYLEYEMPHQLADALGYWEVIKDAKLADKFIDEIKKVSKKDISRVAKKFFTKNYALAVIEQN